VKKGLAGEPTTTLTISDEDFAALCAGEGLAQSYFQNGKLRVDGDMRVAKSLGFLNKLA
jgi:3-hydroxyacyl-CoA dehydrogenase/3a,7a,12a-trihydroxy-5b-cholest-24-enoyl-CoA hydratase